MLDKVDAKEDTDDENTDISSVTDEWQVLLSLDSPPDPDFFHFFICPALLRTEPPNFLMPNANFPFPPAPSDDSRSRPIIDLFSQDLW